MTTLSYKNHIALEERGIVTHSDHYGINITLRSNGIAWLLNYLYSARKIGSTLSLKLLKEVADFQPKEGAWRELRFKAVPIPVYGSDLYFQYIFYLNGTPPRAFHVFPPETTSIKGSLSVPATIDGAFKVRDDQIVNVKFTDVEVSQLQNGELILIK